MKYLRSVVSMQNLPNHTRWTEPNQTETGSDILQRNTPGRGGRGGGAGVRREWVSAPGEGDRRSGATFHLWNTWVTGTSSHQMSFAVTPGGDGQSLTRCILVMAVSCATLKHRLYSWKLKGGTTPPPKKKERKKEGRKEGRGGRKDERRSV